MLNYRRTAAEITGTDYPDQLILEINKEIWSLDNALKDRLESLFKGSAHVAFHQYHPNGRNNKNVTWILFEGGLTAEALPQAKEQLDTFRELAEERFRVFLEPSR